VIGTTGEEQDVNNEGLIEAQAKLTIGGAEDDGDRGEKLRISAESSCKYKGNPQDGVECKRVYSFHCKQKRKTRRRPDIGQFRSLFLLELLTPGYETSSTIPGRERHTLRDTFGARPYYGCCGSLLYTGIRS
jgi:hypothetical protein